MSSATTERDGDRPPHRRNPLQLPPIRTVLGDQLALPTPSVDACPSTASDRSSTASSPYQPRPFLLSFPRTPATNIYPRPPSPFPAPLLPPPVWPSHPYAPSRSPTIPPQLTSRSDVTPFPTAPTSPFPPATPHTAPPYLHVLRPSPSGELITGPSIPRVRSRPGSSGVAKDSDHPTDPKEGGENLMTTRRHVCPICKKRFNRPSSLKTHQSVHTGSRPFPCPHTGCPKSFSVASNMRRHLRKHDPKPSTSVPQQSKSQSPEQSMESSEGEGEGEGDLMDAEMEEDQPQRLPSASASISGGFRSPAAPLHTALSAPGTYFEWTASPHSQTGNASTLQSPSARGRFPTGRESGRNPRHPSQ